MAKDKVLKIFTKQCIGIVSLFAFFVCGCVPSLKAENHAPTSFSDLETMAGQALPMLARGDFKKAYDLAVLHRKYAEKMYGTDDPYVDMAISIEKIYKANLELSSEQKQQFSQVLKEIYRVASDCDELRKSIYPEPDKLYKATQKYRELLLNPKVLPEWEVSLCEGGIDNRFLIVGNWDAARIMELESLHIDCLRGFADTCIEVKDILYLCCTEQDAGLPPAGRRERLEKIIKFFHEEGTKKQRFDWEEHRARAMLAEDYYTENKKDKADKMFAKLREEMPKIPNSSLAGWVLFACDRYDARRAYEQGKYEEALSYIKDAEAGCFRFGDRSASKPLAMQQVYELKAKILRKLGKDQDAQWAKDDAERIAKNLAKCREALAKIPIQIPRVSKRPDGTLHFDFDNPKIIQKGGDNSR